MSSMFNGATAFDGDISGWNTIAVTNMTNMFASASTFNQDLHWNTATVVSMYGMFALATAFNRDISAWNTGAVKDMGSMFYYASAFNKNLNNWNTASVTNMSSMFNGATAFNGDISGWNTVIVTDMSSMFQSAPVFNQNLNNWNTASVTNMSSMFNGATAFNGDISGWNTIAVTDMPTMFRNASTFNQDLHWSNIAVKSMYGMFAGATSFNGDISEWKTSAVTDMSFMFQNASAFNQNLNNWNTVSVTNMSSMFDGATSFNGDLYGWNTGAVTDMSYMFQNASAFNQNIGAWDISSVTTMVNMLNNTRIARVFYDKILKGWDAQAVQFGVSLGAAGRYYCNSVTERNDLINIRGWNITGDDFNCTALPIEVINFTVKKSGNEKVIINWTSGTESNINSITVQRGSDGAHWTTLNIVSPKGSNRQYEVFDNNPMSGNNFYRLMMTNADGSVSYSDVKEITFTGLLSVKIYPNPTTGTFTVNHIKTGDEIIIRDISGRQLLQRVATGEKQVLDIHNLSQGMYFLSVIRDGAIVANDKVNKVN